MCGGESCKEKEIKESKNKRIRCTGEERKGEQ
jgi:hypothetical protein